MKHEPTCPLERHADNGMPPISFCTCKPEPYFKTQADIWAYLINERGEVAAKNGLVARFRLKDGFLQSNILGTSTPIFDDPEYWKPYHEPKTIKRWAVIYDTDMIDIYDTDLKPARRKDVSAIVPVTITYTEGEGL